MAARRRVSPQDGARAARQWAAAQEGQSLPRQVTATAVRFTLEELAACAPGRSVEVRVPPFGAVQATGRLGWQEAMASGALAASGERCDLSPYLPLLRA